VTSCLHLVDTGVFDLPQGSPTRPAASVLQLSSIAFSGGRTSGVFVFVHHEGKCRDVERRFMSYFSLVDANSTSDPHGKVTRLQRAFDDVADFRRETGRWCAELRHEIAMVAWAGRIFMP